MLVSATAHAEGKIRIAEQFGVVYLMLNVAQDQKLIEKHGKKDGIDIDVDWIKLSGGNAVNDALLSGSIDIAGAGVGPLLTIWDRTYGRQNVRGVASLGNFPYQLISTNPAVKSIADLSDKDRIALPAGAGLGAGAHPADGGGQAMGRGRIQAARQVHPVLAAPGRRRRGDRRRHRDQRPLRHPAVPGAGAGRQSEGPRGARVV